jgi:dTDP-4-amino-4,6-dideoxygalactose transaminase
VDAVVLETTLGYTPVAGSLGVPIIEDISQGVGGHDGRERAGSRGDVVVMGLEPEHIITAGGGAVVLAAGRKLHTGLKRLADSLGRDLLLPDMNSSLGLTQIKEIESFVAKRSEIAQIFSRAMMRSKHKTPVQPGDGENVFFSFPVLLNSGLKDVATYARKNGVETRPAFTDAILGRFGEVDTGASPDLPNAKAWLMRCILFPLFPTLTKKDLELITRVLGTLP